jgi:hypothetical protein
MTELKGANNMSKRLILAGGIFNAFFTVFHIWLGWQIQMIQDLLPEYKSLMQMLNVAGTLTIAFATFASFFCMDDLLGTGLGRATIILVAIFYASRAIEEIILAPQFSPVIFGVCLVVAMIYMLAIAGAIRKPVIA